MIATQEHRETATLLGAISAVNVEEGTYQLKRASGGHLAGVFAPELRETLIAALRVFPESKVLVLGQVVFDQLAQPQKIEQTASLQILDPNDLAAQLEDLATMQDGWLDGKGIAPRRENLDWFAAAWEKNIPLELPKPYIYPTPEGGIQLEWSQGGWELAAEIDFKEKTALLVGVNTINKNDVELQSNLKTSEGWIQLIDFVKNHSKTDKIKDEQ
jgi:hypothetical protein